MSIALIIVPIFALILMGWAARRWMESAEAFWRGLERLIYFVFFPALLFHTLSHARMDFAAATPMLLVGITYTVLGMGLGYLSKSLFNDPPRVFAAAFQCSFRFNSYVGLAVAGALHGKPGIAAIGLLMGFLVPLANVAAVAVLARHGEGNWLKSLLGNPLILATAGGLAFSQAGLALPGVVDNTLELLARASLPLGLIVVGAGMRLSGLGHARGHLWYGVMVKLLLLPAIAWGLGRAAGLQGLWFDTALLLAALPHSTVAYLLAVRMGADGQVSANQITVTTLLSMLTLPVWLALARGG
ncbi:MAG: AEC family transporter [Pseudomonadota bacterium]|nr:AEC family transporter [Pseudomonadota bacterium]MDP1573026.1 AEC family transporter [Pseudomonadota bacterium]MDP1903184.1 AEC family transporter [Pseudomonadota bacterium]